MAESSFNAQVWLFASNASSFNVEEAFADDEEIRWSETSNAHVQLGDTVFLYGTKPTQTLTHQCIVAETGLPDDESEDCGAHWVDDAAYQEREDRTWMALRLVRVLSNTERKRLSLAAMQKVGLTGGIQGRRRAPEGVRALLEQVLLASPIPPDEDSTAEGYPADEQLVDEFTHRMDAGRYTASDLETYVPDRYSYQKTRGSAQKAFANRVKANYGYTCAVTGITTPYFLVASHIVPWSEDPAIRLDPTNGICLSTLVDRAFEDGYLRIAPDSVVHVNQDKISHDPILVQELMQYNGVQLQQPSTHPPHPKWLQRRWDSNQQ